MNAQTAPGLLLPASLVDYVSGDTPVRALEAFIDALDLKALGFAGMMPAETGRPAYHPATMLKIYAYGYLNHDQSSRRLEREAVRHVEAREEEVRLAPDQQVSLTAPDSCAMTSAGRGTSIVGYNLQATVDAERHLIVAHELLNIGSDRAQLSSMAAKAMAMAMAMAMAVDVLEAIADNDYSKGEEIRTCQGIGVAAFVPGPLTSGAKAQGRFGKQDFIYVEQEKIYRCPTDERLIYRYTFVEADMTLHSYWTSNCQSCALYDQCTIGKGRRIKRWEHEAVVEAMDQRLNRRPDAMRIRRQTVEQPFGTLTAWMGSMHFLTTTPKNVRTEIGLHILAYNTKRLIAIFGVRPLIVAMRT